VGLFYLGRLPFAALHITERVWHTRGLPSQRRDRSRLPLCSPHTPRLTSFLALPCRPLLCPVLRVTCAICVLWCRQPGRSGGRPPLPFSTTPLLSLYLATHLSLPCALRCVPCAICVLGCRQPRCSGDRPLCHSARLHFQAAAPSLAPQRQPHCLRRIQQPLHVLRLRRGGGGRGSGRGRGGARHDSTAESTQLGVWRGLWAASRLHFLKKGKGVPGLGPVKE